MKETFFKKVFKTAASKIIAGVLIVAMVAAMVGGCSGKQGTVEGEKDSEQGNVLDEAADTEKNGFFEAGSTDEDAPEAVLSSERVVQGDWVYESLVYYGGEMYDGGFYAVKRDGSEMRKITGRSAESFVVADDRIYFSSDGIRAVRTDGSSDHIQVLSEIPVSGSFAVAGDLIYFKPLRERGLYVMKTDGSDIQLLSDISDFRAMGSYIYYLSYDGGLYAMRTDGAGKRILTDRDDIGNIEVVGDWIYFSTKTSSEAKGLYAIKTDGSEERVLVDNKVSDFEIVGDWIIIESSYLIRTDGSVKHEFEKYDYWSGISSIEFAGDHIYYSIGNYGGAVCVSTLDGSENRVLVDDSLYETDNYVNLTLEGVEDDWVYFSIPKGDADYKGIYAVKTDGSEVRTLVLVRSLWAVNAVTDGWIYYETYSLNNGTELYAIRTDGSDGHKLTH